MLPRLHERVADGSIVRHPIPEVLEPAHPILRLQAVTPDQLHATLQVTGANRAAALADPARAPVAARLVPEDLTRRARVLYVSVGNFTDAGFAEFAARVGRIEGFSVVARVAPKSEWADQLSRIPGLEVIELPGPEYVWTEDILEIGLDGTFRMTARMGNRALLRRSLFVDRLRRFYPELTAADLAEINALPAVEGGPPGELSPLIMLAHPDILFDIQGLVEKDGGQQVGAVMALARGAALGEGVMYLEGGNVLVGTLPGGEAYALVGRDSAAVAKAVLEHQFRRPVGEAEVIAAMARDVGVEPARLFLIEQPGTFHLDMSMTLLAPGTVVMNDALEAFVLQTAWLRDDHEASRPRREAAAAEEEEYLRELDLWRARGQDLDEAIRKLARYTARFARFEARTLADLERAGLRVIRVAGRFLHPARPADRDVMNFFNGEAGSSARGGTYFVTQGGDPRAERYIADALLAPGTGLDRLYVAPRLISRDTLWERGGMGCRAKVEGDLVAPGPARD